LFEKWNLEYVEHVLFNVQKNDISLYGFCFVFITLVLAIKCGNVNV